MKIYVTVVLILLGSVCDSEPWSVNRFESFLRNSGRFIESDNLAEDQIDLPNRSRNALPLFSDVMAENGWSTNDLVCALVHSVSNGLLSANWESAETKRTVAVAVRQLADINHPAVTNYFSKIASDDLHGLEKIVIPALFKYTFLEQDVIERIQALSVQTNRYDSASPLVVWDMLDCLSSMPESERDVAKSRVAKFLYSSTRHVTILQSWQEEQLAKLVPEYSNSVERLEQTRFLIQHSTNDYERARLSLQFDRLNAMPTNTLTRVPWIVSP